MHAFYTDVLSPTVRYQLIIFRVGFLACLAFPWLAHLCQHLSNTLVTKDFPGFSVAKTWKVFTCNHMGVGRIQASNN